MKKEYLVKIENLYKSYEKHDRFKTHKKEVLAGININIQKDEIFGLVGESGCGKSTICNLILGLDKCDRGKIIFDNVDITNMKEKDMRPIRKNMQAVFQDSKSSLNPKMKVYDILNEPLKNYNLENSHRIKELVELVGLDENSLKKYPHEFSGGQRQRISIARSLALNPKFIILDESTSNLDTITLNRILELLKDLKRMFSMTYLVVSHDIDIIKKFCDRVAIMEDGRIVEVLQKDDMENAKHPYTRKLLHIM